MWDVIKGFLAVAGGCFTMLVVLAFLTKESGDTPSATRQQFASEEPEPVAAVNVSAVALGDAYEANSVAADMRFKGRRLRITGDVNSISTDMFDQAVVELQSSQFLSTTRRATSSPRTGSTV
jgi:hypothetical protein